jgi:hypothetical protein
MQHALNNRQQKRRRLAGASVGETNQITALEHMRNRPILNRRRQFIAMRLNIELQASVKPEVHKLVNRLKHLFLKRHNSLVNKFIRINRFDFGLTMVPARKYRTPTPPAAAS